MGADFDIRGLQIPMDDAFFVRRFDALGDVDEQGDRFVHRHWTAGDPFGERLAFHELHRQELPATRFLQSVKRGDVGMIELREEFCFSFESIETFFVTRELFR